MKSMAGRPKEHAKKPSATQAKPKDKETSKDNKGVAMSKKKKD